MTYLSRFGKSVTNECQMCATVDKAEHVIFECTALLDFRAYRLTSRTVCTSLGLSVLTILCVVRRLIKFSVTSCRGC